MNNIVLSILKNKEVSLKGHSSLTLKQRHSVNKINTRQKIQSKAYNSEYKVNKSGDEALKGRV